MNQMIYRNLNIQGEKPGRNDAGQLCLDNRVTQAAWKEHYERLSNVEFDWDLDSLTEVYPVIPSELVIKAIKLMKYGYGIAEMLKTSGVEGGQQIHDLIQDIIYFGKILTEWEESITVSLYKGKGVALEQANYQGLN